MYRVYDVRVLNASVLFTIIGWKRYDPLMGEIEEGVKDIIH